MIQVLPGGRPPQATTTVPPPRSVTVKLAIVSRAGYPFDVRLPVGATMITKRLSIMLGVATVGVALLAPISGSMARGGGGSSTNGSFPTGLNQNPNAGNGGSGSGSNNGSFPTGPNQNPNAGNGGSGSGGSSSGNGGLFPHECHVSGTAGSGS